MSSKGWILLENGKLVVTTNNSYEVFKTKQELLDYYGDALGELNSVQRIEIFMPLTKKEKELLKFAKNIKRRKRLSKNNED